MKKKLKSYAMKNTVKPSFPFLCPIVYDPNPKGVTEEGKKLIGKVMLFLGDIPDAGGYGSGHCAVLHEEKVLWMMHPDSFRAATEEEF